MIIKYMLDLAAQRENEPQLQLYNMKKIRVNVTCMKGNNHIGISCFSASHLSSQWKNCWLTHKLKLYCAVNSYQIWYWRYARSHGFKQGSYFLKKHFRAEQVCRRLFRFVFLRRPVALLGAVCFFLWCSWLLMCLRSVGCRFIHRV